MDDIARTLASSIANRYRIERKLGTGGMADVYLARDLTYGRDVAIKVLKPELAQALGSQRFLREIQLVARLQHPHILSLVDSGAVGDVPYYVMPYQAAGSLRARLERERELPVADALQIMREVAGALAYAHAAGVIHRDIKPENILFSAGHAQVSDFGIARILSGTNGSPVGTALTTMGMTLGTPQYMAPEQAAGDPRVDHRADLYAFGALAYEILAGVPPFVASNPAQLGAMHMNQEPRPLSSLRPSVPKPIERVVMRCLQKRPADRWQSAHDLLLELDRIAAAGRPPTPEPRGAGTVTGHFVITENVARRLDRRSFDPRMIGDSIEYLDNHVESDVLVMLHNALWLDSTDFEPHLRMLPYRCIAPTPYGFAMNSRYRFDLSLRDHIILFSELLQAFVEAQRPALVVVVGFSASADLVLVLPGAIPEDRRQPDGILALGPNQGIETCFISRVLAGLDSHDPPRLLAALREISEVATTLDEWIMLNGYLARIVTRFQADISPLRSPARDICEPFERDPDAFAHMYREATGKVRNVRVVFENSETCNRLLRPVLLDHMERRVLGGHHRDGAILIEPTPNHFELVQPERVARHLAAMVSELRSERR